MKKLIFPAWIMLCMSASGQTIDGNLTDPQYTIAGTGTGTSRDGFGTDNEVGLIKMYSNATTLFVGITGKINSNNNIVVFMDFNNYIGRGTSTLAGSSTSSTGVFTTNGTGSCGGSGGLNGAIMDAGFDADYAFAFNEGVSSTNFYLDAMKFMSGSFGYDGNGYVGNSGSQSGGSGSFALPFGGTGNITFAYRNDYTTGSNLGIEFSIPYSAIPGVNVSDQVSFFVVITNSEGFMSNESIPADMGGANAGCDPNLSAIAGQTLYTSSLTLPVKFTGISGSIWQNQAFIKWSVSDETNIYRYDLEESVNGLSFSKISSAAAAQRSSYELVDNNVEKGTHFYRIKAVEITGGFIYSNIIRLTNGKAAALVTVFPNPASDKLNISFTGMKKGIYTLRLFNNSGQNVLSETIAHDGADKTKQLILPPQITHGIYRLSLSNGSDFFYQTIAVE